MQIPGTDDLSDLERTRNAFTVLGILLLKSHDCMNIKFNNMTEKQHLRCAESAGVQSEQQMELFRILSAVLHLGNVNIQASGRSADRSYISVIIILHFCSPTSCPNSFTVM